ncbi:hypothetical protein C8R48DRAFT_771099 [Suillus tomentosus]|nr:hypothetical protein C8R48DRAFT_771099 [Suillus tomentosus]
MNSSTQDSVIDLSLDTQQDYAHLLVFPLCYDSFIPALHLPISALLDFTNLPPFDHSLTTTDLNHFFTSEHYVANDVLADFLDRSLPPLCLSTQLLDIFGQAYHDGMKSVKDPQFLVAMINTIRHFLFDVPLFMDKKKDFLCINELIYLLQGHFSASDDDCHTPSDSLSQPTSFSECPFSHESSASPMSSNIPPSKSCVSLDLRVSPSQPRTGLLRHFSIISWQEYLDAVHEEDLVRSDEREEEKFSAMLKAREKKLLKCTRD